MSYQDVWREAEVFFTTHPVFTLGEFGAFLACRSGQQFPHPEARKSLLRHHQARGRIVRIRRGLYGAIPPGQPPERYPIDTFLIASRATEDAVLAYHTALSLHGIAHSIREERLCLTGKDPTRPFTFQGVAYRAVSPPQSLPHDDALTDEIEKHDRQGMSLWVTTLERTFVDVLDRPVLLGGWEEAWRSLEGVDVFLDANRIVRYTLLLDNATTTAKVGYFLDLNRDRLHIANKYLDPLRAHMPQRPHYVERNRRSNARLVKDWNLMIPAALFAQGNDEIEAIPV